MIVDLILEDNTKVVFSSYDSRPKDMNSGQLAILLNDIDLTYILKTRDGWLVED